MTRLLSFFALATVVAGGALAACGENHEVIGSRSGSGGAGGAATGGDGQAAGRVGAQAGAAAGGRGGTGGGSSGQGGAGALAGMSALTGGSSGSGGRGGGSSSGGSSVGGSSVGGSSAGGSGGVSGSAGQSGMSAGGLAGEAGASGAGMAGVSAAGGAGGSAAACPTSCNNDTQGGCVTGEVTWTCTAAGYDYQEFVDGGCRDQGTDLQRFCCPAEFYASCKTPCADLSTRAACDARDDCHSVLLDPGTCGCGAPGCCAHFSRCADGYSVDCTGSNISCTITMPFCDKPTYVLSYAGGCYEGCVDPKHCQVQ